MVENNNNNEIKQPKSNDNLSIQPEGMDQLIEDQQLLGIYAEILDDLRSDRKEIDEVLSRFVDMVLNEGDATTSSKEAIVNLIKTKTDMSDKKAKVADLMTRVKLKEKDTMPKWLAKQINDKKDDVQETKKLSRREMLKTLDRAKKKKESADGK